MAARTYQEPPTGIDPARATFSGSSGGSRKRRSRRRVRALDAAHYVGHKMNDRSFTPREADDVEPELLQGQPSRPDVPPVRAVQARRVARQAAVRELGQG